MSARLFSASRSRYLRFIADTKPHERPALAIAFLYFFCVLAAYYVIRPVRDQLSAAVGSRSLPIFFAATFIVTLLLTPVFGALVARFPRKRFVPVVYLFFIACLLGFIPLFQAQSTIDPKVLGAVFFVWVSVFNLFVVSVFWSFMADIFDSDQARRLFAAIAIGGALGAITGPIIASNLVEYTGVAALLFVSASLLGVALICIFALITWSHRHPVAGDLQRDVRVIGGNVFAGASQLLHSPFLRRMAALTLLGDCIGTVVYALVADHVQAHYTTSELRTAVYAHLDLATNSLQILLQATLTRFLLARYGSVSGLIAPAILNILMLLALALLGDPMIAAVMIITRSSANGILKPASDSLYTRVDREIRYKGKNFIDTVVWRFGDVTISSLFNLLRSFGTSVPGFALLCVGVSALAGWVGYRITRSDDLRPESNQLRN